jgi:hypothetical protein
VLSVNPSANGVASGHLRDSVGKEVISSFIQPICQHFYIYILDLVVLLVKSCANVATPPLVVSDSNRLVCD